MEPYFYVFSFIFITGCICFPLKKYTVFLNFSVAIVLVFFAGFRHVGVGADDYNYVQQFMITPGLNSWFSSSYVYRYLDSYMEPGFVFLNSILRYFTDDYRFLFLTVASISIFITAYCYRKLSPYPLFSFLIYFVHAYLYRDMNQIRAGLAVSMGLFLIFSMHDRKILKTIIIILSACLFHMSAIIYFLFVLFNKLALSRGLALLLLTLAIFLNLADVPAFLINNIPSLGYISAKVTSYAASTEADTTALFDLTNIKNIFICASVLFFFKRFKAEVKYFDVMFSMFFLSVLWRILFSDFGILAGRVSTFLSVTEPILISCFIVFFNKKIIPIMLIFLYSFLVLYINLFVKEGRFPYLLSF